MNENLLKELKEQYGEKCKFLGKLRTFHRVLLKDEVKKWKYKH